jgi:hypothetical protein
MRCPRSRPAPLTHTLCRGSPLRVAAGFISHRLFWSTDAVPEAQMAACAPWESPVPPRTLVVCRVFAGPTAAAAGNAVQYELTWRDAAGSHAVRGPRPEGTVAASPCAMAPIGPCRCQDARGVDPRPDALVQLYRRLERAHPDVLRFRARVSAETGAAFWGLALPIVQAWLSYQDTSLLPADLT